MCVCVCVIASAPRKEHGVADVGEGGEGGQSREMDKRKYKTK